MWQGVRLAVGCAALALALNNGARAEDVNAALDAVASAAVEAYGAGSVDPGAPGGRFRPDVAAPAADAAVDSVGSADPARVQAKGYDSLDLGAWSVTWGSGVSNLTVDRISNQSATHTTGTLQLRLLASTVSPSLGTPFYAYTLSKYSNLNPLLPGYYYYNITRTSTFAPPPDGTYYITLALFEYAPANCTSADSFCLVDVAVGESTSTFGAAARVTAVVRLNATTSMCVAQYPAAAVPGLINAGYQVTQYAPTTSCSSLGYPFQVGPLLSNGQVIDPAIVIWASTAADAAAVCATGYVSCASLPPAPTAGNVVVEYYWASRDHYFISADPAEIAALDSGKFGGWTRTGQTFKSVAPTSANASPVCRFYIPPLYGDSHLFSASPAECSDARTVFPMFTYEAASVFYMMLPNLTTGVCPSGTIPVYRLWDNRPDTNHRYTTSLTIKNQMLTLRYTSEGYGPNGVAMCAVQ